MSVIDQHSYRPWPRRARDMMRGIAGMPSVSRPPSAHNASQSLVEGCVKLAGHIVGIFYVCVLFHLSDQGGSDTSSRKRGSW